MKLAALFLFAVLALPAQKTTLRYQFAPGQTDRYRIESRSTTTVKRGSAPERPTAEQNLSMTVQRKVLSRKDGQAVVEETPLQGASKTHTAAGTTVAAVPQITRRYTFLPTGRLVKMERVVPPGVQDNDSRFLEGMNFALPEKPVAPGDRWSGECSVVGIDGKPLIVRYRGRLVGTARRAGLECAQMEIAFSSSFRTAADRQGRSLSGTLSGTVTSWLARDRGIDVEIVAEMTLITTSSMQSESGDEKVVSTTRISQRQTWIR
jgi:hypothetical protein